MMPARLSRIFRSHTTWRVVLFVIIGLAFFHRVSPLMPFTGDEPHYLLGTISLVNDGDFNVFNNYANQDYRQFGYTELHPQHLESSPGVLITEHGIGFPALLAIPWKIKKIAGVRYTLFFGALLTIFLAARCTDLLSGNSWAGTMTALLLGFCPTWLMHSRMVFPECTAGFVTALVSLLLISLSRNPQADRERLRPFALGLLFFFPTVYVRYVPLLAPLYLMVLFSPVMRRMRWLYAGLACGTLLLIAVLIRFPEPGSIGATNFASQGSQFLLDGAFGRLWRSWFDRRFGLVVYTPWVLLAFWAVVYHLPRLRSFRVGYTQSAAIALLGYCLMFGLWVQHPGASVPGRYLCAAVPLMAILVTLWCAQTGKLLNPRTVLAAALLCISVKYVLVSLWIPLQPWRLYPGYTSLYPEYWGPAWATPDNGNAPRFLGITLLILVIAGKLGSRLLRKPAAPVRSPA